LKAFYLVLDKGFAEISPWRDVKQDQEGHEESVQSPDTPEDSESTRQPKISSNYDAENSLLTLRVKNRGDLRKLDVVVSGEVKESVTEPEQGQEIEVDVTNPSDVELKTRRSKGIVG